MRHGKNETVALPTGAAWSNLAVEWHTVLEWYRPTKGGKQFLLKTNHGQYAIPQPDVSFVFTCFEKLPLPSKIVSVLSL